MTDGARHRRANDWARGLLVSVRNVEEGLAALAGAAIVDVKEPSRGPLGTAEAPVAADILVAVAGRASVTLACGELADGPSRIAEHVRTVCARLPNHLARPAAVKVGPAGLGTEAWRSPFRDLAGNLPEGIEAVAVAYADWQAASCLAPEDLFVEAASCGARVVLVDTFDKAGPGIFSVVDAATIARWIDSAHGLGLRVTLAGKLTRRDLEAALGLGADVVGVRSAACAGGRLGWVDPARVRDLGRLAASSRVVSDPQASGEPLP